jgi:hypothetical protein
LPYGNRCRCSGSGICGCSPPACICRRFLAVQEVVRAAARAVCETRAVTPQIPAAPYEVAKHRHAKRVTREKPVWPSSWGGLATGYRVVVGMLCRLTSRTPRGRSLRPLGRRGEAAWCVLGHAWSSALRCGLARGVRDPRTDVSENETYGTLAGDALKASHTGEG